MNMKKKTFKQKLNKNNVSFLSNTLRKCYILSFSSVY